MSDETPKSDPRDVVWRFHQLTKHRKGQMAPGPGRMDWAKQPDPWRHFEGARKIPLPLDQEASSDQPFAALSHPLEDRTEATLERLSSMLELGLGVSAWKSHGQNRWALRNNPSSGNLHPVEGYVLALSISGLAPGLYHYRPKEHDLELRRSLDTAEAYSLAARFGDVPGLLLLTSIHWREIWKYGLRGWRYCRHDEGHALASLRYAAQLQGWGLALLDRLRPTEAAAIAGIGRIEDYDDAEAEFPGPVLAIDALPGKPLAGSKRGWHGKASRLSATVRDWPAADAMSDVILSREARAGGALPAGEITTESLDAICPEADAADIIRRRRSAVAMDPSVSMKLTEFVRMMAATLPDSRRPPFDALPFAPAVHLLVCVHRVEQLSPGLYLLTRHPGRAQALIDAMSGEQIRPEKLEGMPLPLWRLAGATDTRPFAKAASCNQDIAADGAFTIAMLTDFRAVMMLEGADGYRRLHHECGVIGQVLYLEAEAAGFSGTGIGCFFDDMVHRQFGFGEVPDWQDLYHFAVGRAVTDDRLTTDPGYPPDHPARQSR